MNVTAVNVFPLPVAIWIRGAGTVSESDFSRFFIALICADQRPSSIKGGIS